MCTKAYDFRCNTIYDDEGVFGDTVTTCNSCSIFSLSYPPSRQENAVMVWFKITEKIIIVSIIFHCTV